MLYNLVMTFDPVKHHGKGDTVLYILHDGSHMQQQKAERFIEQISRRTDQPAYEISVRSPVGEKLRTSHGYSLAHLPVTLIVRDGSLILYTWTGTEHVTPEHVATLLRQTSHRH